MAALEANEINTATALAATTAMTSWQQQLLKDIDAQLKTQSNVIVDLSIDVLLKEMRVQTSLSRGDVEDAETTQQRLDDMRQELRAKIQRHDELMQQRQQLLQQ